MGSALRNPAAFFISSTAINALAAPLRSQQFGGILEVVFSYGEAKAALSVCFLFALTCENGVIQKSKQCEARV